MGTKVRVQCKNVVGTKHFKIKDPFGKQKKGRFKPSLTFTGMTLKALIAVDGGVSYQGTIWKVLQARKTSDNKEQTLVRGNMATREQKRWSSWTNLLHKR